MTNDDWNPLPDDLRRDAVNSIDLNSKFCDTYFYDDLLVNTTREIIANGMTTPNVPATIKDWVAGKILAALPSQLARRLINFVLENRINQNKLGYRENKRGDEFTLLIYKTEKQYKSRMYQLENPTQNSHLKVDNRSPAEYHPIDLQENGFEFTCEEMICEIGTQIPMKQEERLKVIARAKATEQPDMMSDFDDGRVSSDDADFTPASKNLAVNGDSTKSAAQRNRKRKASSKDSSSSKKRKNGFRERLVDWNQAYKNVRDEGIYQITESDEEKLKDLNALCAVYQDGGIKNPEVKERDAEYDEKGNWVPFNKRAIPSSGNRPPRVPVAVACPICDNLYPTKKKGLFDHVEKFHPQEWPEFWKTNRPKSSKLAELDKYKEYWSLDHQTGDYVCNICAYCQPSRSKIKPNGEKDSTNLFNFVKHIKCKHAKDSLYKCEICGVEVAYKANYNRHMKAHAGKPFICNYHNCNSKFTDDNHLIRHIEKSHPEIYQEEKMKRINKKEMDRIAILNRRQSEREEKKYGRAKERAEKRAKFSTEAKQKLIDIEINARNGKDLIDVIQEID